MSANREGTFVFEGSGELQTDERTVASVRYGVDVVDKRLSERWEGVAIGEEAAKFTFDSSVVARPNRTNMHIVNKMLTGVVLPSERSSSSSEEPTATTTRALTSSNEVEAVKSRRPLQQCEVLPSVGIASLLNLEKNITRLETILRGVNYTSSAILEMERYLSNYQDNQQLVRRSLDTIDVKTETLHQQIKRNLGQALDPEGAASMCRRLEVLVALAPAINSAKANLDALDAIVGEWPEVKRGAEMVVASLEEHEQTLNAVEEDLEELEHQLDTAERNVAKSFDIFERELLQTAKRYM